MVRFHCPLIVFYYYNNKTCILIFIIIILLKFYLFYSFFVPMTTQMYRFQVEAVIGQKLKNISTSARESRNHENNDSGLVELKKELANWKKGKSCSEPLLARTRVPCKAPRVVLTGFTNNTCNIAWQKPEMHVVIRDGENDEDGENDDNKDDDDDDNDSDKTHDSNSSLHKKDGKDKSEEDDDHTSAPTNGKIRSSKSHVVDSYKSHALSRESSASSKTFFHSPPLPPPPSLPAKKHVKLLLLGYRLDVNGTPHMRISPATSKCTLVHCVPGQRYIITLRAITCPLNAHAQRKSRKVGWVGMKVREGFDGKVIKMRGKKDEKRGMRCRWRERRRWMRGVVGVDTNNSSF